MKLILPVEVAAEIEPHLPSYAKVVLVDSDGNLDGDASDAEIYLSWFFLKPPTLHRVLAAAPSLRWHHAPNAGVNHILTPIYLARDFILTNGSGTHGITISEFVIAYILAHAKFLRELYTAQTEHIWRRDFAFQELNNANLLIIGAGSIGQAIAARAKAFGMNVFGSRRHPQKLANFDQVVGANEWRSLLPSVDYVVIATPLTAETRNLINEEVLRTLPKHAYLINIARGAIVDESALITALTEGWIAGAALDTVVTEPLPPESPLWTVPNLFLTPHCSAHSPKIKQRSLDLFIDNLQRYLRGEPLRNVVDKSAGY